MQSKEPHKRGTRLIALAVAPAALLVTGCTATGMGWTRGASGQKVTFGFSAAAQPGTDASGQFLDIGSASFSGSYHDPQGKTLKGTVSVDLKGSGVVKKTSPPVGLSSINGPCLTGDAGYTSQNPRLRGKGTLRLTVCDGDGNFVVKNGASDVTIPLSGDYMQIDVATGPYAGYNNAGLVEGGNITVKP